MCGRAPRFSLVIPVALVLLSLTSCGGPLRPKGERLARTHCAACHAFPEPQLLDKESWRASVLPQMAPRLRVSTTLFDEAFRNPNLAVMGQRVSEEDWQEIVRYYVQTAPDALPEQSLPALPRLDPAFFAAGPFAPGISGDAIITLLEVDSSRERVFVAEAINNRLLIFGWGRNPQAALTAGSPVTDVIALPEQLLVLESGILHPNDEPRGRLVRYDVTGMRAPRFSQVVIDSLYRPVFVEQVDWDHDGLNDFIICEFGDNRGRLALYRNHGSGFRREILSPDPGAIRVELRDLTGDGHADIVALLAQGDERIVLFENDGAGRFSAPPRILARFPPVYGSMHFALHDFNGDGHLDILYANGDNFDLSRVLKPYHGIRILENDGDNRFTERYFFPIHGAARAEAVDFDRDGDLDILTASNFADFERHPERGIMFFENTGGYRFEPHAFTIASHNQWNLMATADVNRDGWPDALVGAMSLERVIQIQQGVTGQSPAAPREPILYFENRMRAR